MKKLLIILSLFITSHIVISQEDITPKITECISTSNVKGLCVYFSDNIDMEIDDEWDIYTRSQSEIVLKDFFSKNTPTNFLIIQKGESKMGVFFKIGILKTKQGRSYRIIFNIKSVNDNFKISQIQINEN